MDFFGSTSTTLISLMQLTSNIKIPVSPPFTQFPSDVIKIMKTNVSPSKSIKLMNTNKYFIPEEPPFKYLGDDAKLYTNQVSLSKEKVSRKIEELPDNLGLAGCFTLGDEKFLHEFIIRIILHDLKCLIFHLDNISFNGFKLACSLKPIHINLVDVVVTSDNNKIVPYEELIDHMPSVRHLTIWYGRFPQNFMTDDVTTFPQGFIDKLCSSNLEKFTIIALDNHFDFQKFIKSMKKKPNIDLELYFNEFSDVTPIDEYVDKLLEDGITDSFPPLICHPSMNSLNRTLLQQLRRNFHLSKSDN